MQTPHIYTHLRKHLTFIPIYANTSHLYPFTQTPHIYTHLHSKTTPISTL